MKDEILLLFTLLCFLLTSCDTFNSTKICNQKGYDIKVTLDFNEVEINKNGPLDDDNIVATYLRMFHIWNPNLIVINLDSTNYIGEYWIRPNTCAEIQGGNNLRPHFDGFKSIKIITKKDTLLLDTDRKMRDAFGADREKPEINFDLIIQ